MVTDHAAPKVPGFVIGDALAELRKLPSEWAHACVTSPPYWGLRDYGVAGQIGLEQTPDAYVARLVDVFREVRRVLRADGTLWVNLGDSYATGAGKAKLPGGGEQGGRWLGETTRHRDARRRDHGRPARNGRGEPQAFAGERGGHEGKHGYRIGPTTQPNRMPIDGLKPKDLIGIPWRVAFALQADGWHLRSDIIWAKPNPMPESVTDRPTKAHEYIFLLSKSRRYYYDAAAVAEPSVERRSGNSERKYRGDHGGVSDDRSRSHQGFSVPWSGETRNRRTVWNVATRPYSGAHFATFPPKLIEPCILAGVPGGGHRG